MDEPELLRLLMMHMSKNYHEDELLKFGDAMFQLHPASDEGQDSQQLDLGNSVISGVLKRKRQAKTKISFLEKSTMSHMNENDLDNGEHEGFEIGQLAMHNVRKHLLGNQDIDQEAIRIQVSKEVVNHHTKGLFDSVTINQEVSVTPSAKFNHISESHKLSSSFLSFNQIND